MCELAVENTSSWLMVDAWESLQSEYTRTADVLDHFDQEINADGGIVLSDGASSFPPSIAADVHRLEEEGEDHAAGGWRFDPVVWRAGRVVGA